MKISIFGKDLFEFKKSQSDAMLMPAYNVIKESAYLPDFMTAMNGGSSFESFNWELITTPGGAIGIENKGKKKAAKKKVVKKKPGPTPKGVYEMRLLHDDSFELNTNREYVDAQLASFKDKLGLIKAEEYDMRRGTEEIASIITRLENRKKYSEHEAYFSQFPYTTPSKVADVTKLHDHLKIGQVAQFMADMPKDAVQVMKDYETNTMALCGKKPVFYIIADKKDFQKSEKRRDPILLAQSPFGHFWQILGAWDKEMLLLEEL